MIYCLEVSSDTDKDKVSSLLKDAGIKHSDLSLIDSGGARHVAFNSPEDLDEGRLSSVLSDVGYVPESFTTSPADFPEEAPAEPESAEPDEDESALHMEVLRNDMLAQDALSRGDEDSYRKHMGALEEAGKRLAELRRSLISRKKTSQGENPMNRPEGDPDREEAEDLYEWLNSQATNKPDVDQDAIQRTVLKVKEMEESAGRPMTEEEKRDAAAFLLGLDDDEVRASLRAHAYLRNLTEPFLCPSCSGKVARSRKNPLRFRCEAGHDSELSLEKVSQGLEDAPDQAPEQEPTHGELSPELRARLNDAMREAEGADAPPLYILGLLDGFFGSSTFREVAMSQEEISQYNEGMKQGSSARGGVSNVVEFAS